MQKSHWLIAMIACSRGEPQWFLYTLIPVLARMFLKGFNDIPIYNKRRLKI